MTSGLFHLFFFFARLCGIAVHSRKKASKKVRPEGFQTDCMPVWVGLLNLTGTVFDNHFVHFQFVLHRHLVGFG